MTPQMTSIIMAAMLLPLQRVLMELLHTVLPQPQAIHHPLHKRSTRPMRRVFKKHIRMYWWLVMPALEGRQMLIFAQSSMFSSSKHTIRKSGENGPTFRDVESRRNNVTNKLAGR